MRSELARALALSLALLGAPGCICGPDVMPIEDMHAKSLRTPYDTLDYFRTAVRYGDCEAIFASLSPESQEWIDKEVGHFTFCTFFGDLKVKRVDPDALSAYAELTIPELIHRSEILRIEPDAQDPGRIWWVQLYLRIGEKPMPMDKTRFRLIRVPGKSPGEAARWTVDLMQWR